MNAAADHLRKQDFQRLFTEALLTAMQNGEPGARQQFLLMHLPLARKISKCLCRWFGMLPEDAEQIGFLGLVQAARRFRPELGYRFSTYASMWVKQLCQRHGPGFAFPIHLPDDVFWRSFRLHQTLERMLSAVGSAGVRAFLNDLDLSGPKTGRQLREFLRVTTVRSLSDRKEPEYAQARQIPERRSTPVDEAKRPETAAKVQAAVSRLHPREAQIIRLRYGFDGCPPQSLTEIGQLFSLTRERIRQLQARAEKRLREHLAHEFAEELTARDQGTVAADAGTAPEPRSTMNADARIPRHSGIVLVDTRAGATARQR